MEIAFLLPRRICSWGVQETSISAPASHLYDRGIPREIPAKTHSRQPGCPPRCQS